ncbi:MAG TPA: hypothetical protein VK973_16760 [Arenicellales bacterium]|nr:hypothetical protein [Arenicellales bacterium]
MRIPMDRSYLLSGLAYGALGMLLGIHMAATQNHGQLVTHAHLMLVGFLLSLLYAVIHRLWLEGEVHVLVAHLQFLLHQAGAVAMVVGLFLLYGGHRPPEAIEPLLSIASLVVLIALLLMLAMVWTSKGAYRTERADVSPAREA